VSDSVTSLEDALAQIPDGARIAFGGGGAGMRRPVAFARALARRGVKGLHVHQFLAGIETDLLIGSGCVASTNCAYLGLLEYGQAPAFQRAARAGEIVVNEYSEFMLMAGLRAADMGLPFIPWRTPWGSETVSHLDLKTVKDPYGGEELIAVPAMELDVCVLQAERADADGFVELPAEPDLIWDYDHLVGRIAKTTIVCVEEIAPIRDPARVALHGREVAHVVEMPHGAWPTGLHPRYGPDVENITEVYLPAAAAGGEELAAYLEDYERQAEAARA
jgi:glutaconate CoA-transferase subunit A